MSETFYPVTHVFPPNGVRTIVQWAGHQISAARTRDRKTGAVSWVTAERGKLVTLPPKGQEERWGAEPECWRPEHPDKWDAPLPPPMERQAQPRMVYRTGRNRYAAMTAQAEQSARTQRELRAFLEEKGLAEVAPAAGDSSRQWWLSEPLTYSDAGEISEREAEGRVARAILTDGIHGKYGGPRANASASSALQRLVHETLQSDDADDEPFRFKPGPRDNTDYLTAFGWFTALNPPEIWHKRREPYELSQAQCVLVWRVIVPPRSFRQIAKSTGGSHEQARRIYGGAIAGVTRAANGKRVLPYMTVADRMAALRERNRRARDHEQD